MTRIITFDELRRSGLRVAEATVPGDGARVEGPAGPGSVPGGFVGDLARELARRRTHSAREWREILLSIFSAFQEFGQVAPHPHEEGYTSEDWAAALVQGLELRGGREEGPEGDIAPQADLGLNCQQAMVGCWKPDPSNPDDVRPSQIGWAHQIASDAARLGCGVFRRFNGPDLSWRSLFSEKVIPAPAAMLTLVAADQFMACSRFTLMFLFCALRGIRMTPTLFDYGGGSRSDDKPGGLDPAIDVSSLLPPYFTKPIYPSDGGWDPAYWDTDEWGGSSVRHAPDDLSTLQQYLLCLHYSGGEEKTRPYWRECCRRKRLGLLAFSDAIGRYFTSLQRTIEHVRVATGIALPSIDSVVPYFLVGNEMDEFWGRDSLESGREMGWFHALLSTPLSVAVRHSTQIKLKFGLAELGSYLSAERTDRITKLRFLARALNDEGVPYALEVLQWYVRGVGTFLATLTSPSEIFETVPELVDVVELALASEALGWTWGEDGADTFLPYTRADLVHLIGIHWYHAWTQQWDGDRLASAPDLFREETGMLDDLRDFLTECYYIPSGYPELAWWVSEIGFPAGVPEESQCDSDTKSNDEADETYQAIVIARRLLLMLATAPACVAWFTLFSEIVGEPDATKTGERDDHSKWGVYSGMGLRRDVAKPGDFGNPDGHSNDFNHCKNGLPRAGWYAFRRAAWLRSRCTGARILHRDSETRSVVLRLTGRFSDPSGASIRRYTHAYVAWLDHTSPATSLTVSFEDASERGVERLSLIPAVDAREIRYGVPISVEGPTTTDPGDGLTSVSVGELTAEDRPYAEVADPSAVSWDWDGWDDGMLVRRGKTWIWTGVNKHTPKAPLCVLVDADEGSERITVA